MTAVGIVLGVVLVAVLVASVAGLIWLDGVDRDRE